MAESYISELGDKLSHGVANTDGSRVKIIAPKLYTDGNNHPSIATALAGKASSTHSHGNIANGGTLTDTAAAAAGNDYVVIRDADNAKIQTSTIKGTDVADAVSKKHSHSTLTLSTTAQAYDGSHTLALPASDPYTSARTPASHTHGNIQNGGTLQSSDVAIANGDKLVITDASDLNKVARASIAFDASTAGQLLSKKGTFENPKEAYLDWGGRNISSGYGPLDAALVDVLGANRFAFGKPAGITIEYTRDGGTTWTDYGTSDAGKIELFTATSGGVNLTIGKADSTNKATADANWSNYKLRITLTNPAFGLYTNIRKIPMLISTNGSNGCKVTIRVISKTNEESGGAWSSMGSMTIGGWSGWNIFNLPSLYTPWSGGSSQKSQHSKIEFLFEATAASAESSQQYSGLTIYRIFGYGSSPAWAKPSVMADTGHLYSFDNAQNATFPASVTAVNFKGILKRELAVSGTIAESVLMQATGSTDQFNITYECAESNKAIVRMYTADDGDETISIGNKVSSTYKEAISVTNGSATITGSLTGNASTATKATQDSDGNAINATYFKSSGNVTLVSNTATKIGTQNGADVKLTLPAIPAAVSVKGNAESSYRTGQVNITPANLGISATTSSVTVGSTTFNKYTHPTTSGNKHVPSGGSSGQFLGWSADGTAAWVANPNTDTKVTSSANHYTPATASGSDKTASASGATAAWSIDVVKGVTLNTDGKGHVTGLSVTSGKIPANPNTDEKVKQTNTTAASSYRVLLSTTTGSSETINGTLKSENFWAKPSDGTFRATQYNVADHCMLKYNASTSAIDFVFS